MLHTKYSRWWFTLIELMIVITILGMVSLATYLPYAHHQKKVLVKQGVKEIVQSLTEARNLAINGINTGSWNLHVGLYFSSWATQVSYYTLGHTWSLDFSTLSSAELLKTKALPQGIQINDISTSNDESLFVFNAISGSGAIFSRPDSGISTPNIVRILASYKWATTPVLQKEIEYYTRSYISDY